MAKNKTIEVNDKQFTLQHPGIKWSLDFMDRYSYDHETGQLKTSGYVEEMIEFIVVDPKDFDIEDFDTPVEARTFGNQVMNFISGGDNRFQKDEEETE